MINSLIIIKQSHDIGKIYQSDMAKEPTKQERGRPTVHEQTEIDRVVQDYFILGVSPAYVIQTTHLSKNTVYEKYRELAKKIADADEKDFLKKYEETRAQHIVFLDNLSVKAFSVLSRIEEKIEKCKDEDIPPYLLQMFSSIANNLITIGKERNSHTLKPTLLEDLRKTIREELEE